MLVRWHTIGGELDVCSYGINNGGPILMFSLFIWPQLFSGRIYSGICAVSGI